MIKDILKNLEPHSLVRIANNANVSLPANLSHQELVVLIAEFFEDERLDKESQLNLAARMGKFKYSISPYAELSYSFHETSTLNDSYGHTFIHIMQRDPNWCYIYWDINKNKKLYTLDDAHYVIEVLEMTEYYSHSYIIEIDHAQISHYINIPLGLSKLQVSLHYYTDTIADKIQLSLSNTLVFTPHYSNGYDGYDDLHIQNYRGV